MDESTARILNGRRDLGLETMFVGRRIHHLSTVASTNAYAQELSRRGESEGTVVLADEQTEGRGRARRAWFSPQGLGVWASILVSPGLMAERLAPLSIVTAVAVARALRAVSGVSVGIKWPNDIVLDGRKIGGVLVESGEIAGEPVSGAVVGIGVNVGHAESDFPPELEGTAASVAMIAGKPVDRIKVLASVLEHFEEHYREFLAEGFAPARERWRTFSTTLDREITVESCGRRITGTVVDMAPSGALVVEDPTGQRVEIWHGDVVPGTMSTADHVVQDGAGARHD